MADTPSKTGDLIEIFWSLLLLVCMGLIVAHVAWASRSQTAPDEDLIGQTFTAQTSDR
jgi:hypothetical protein